METPPPTLNNIMTKVGVEFYRCLKPRDISALSRTNRRTNKEINEMLFLICIQQLKQLPDADKSNFGPSAATTSVSITQGQTSHTYADKFELAESIVQQIETENLRLGWSSRDLNSCTDTLQATLAAVRSSVSNNDNWKTTKSCEQWNDGFHTNPADIWKPPKSFKISCRFMSELRPGRSRQTYIDMMLERMFKRDVTTNPSEVSLSSRQDWLARDWARFIIARHDIVGREWKWNVDEDCSVGFMFSLPDGEKMEIRYTQKAAAPQPYEFSNPHSSSSSGGDDNLLAAFGF